LFAFFCTPSLLNGGYPRQIEILEGDIIKSQAKKITCGTIGFETEITAPLKALPRKSGASCRAWPVFFAFAVLI
jgi:hypothetical protein